MMKNKILFFIAGLSAISNLYGQKEQSVFPASPEVASIGKFIDQPMSLSRGIPDISIPIYGIKVNNELSYSIGLQYQAGGIRVNEMAGRTGLGWNLNNTSLITRTVKDKPDDFQGNGYMYHTQNFENVKTHFSSQGLNMQYLADTFDFEPDEYTVNANGLNFKFYYDKQNQKFIQTPLSNIKLEPQYNTQGRIISWLVTDSNGVKYYFGINNMVDFSSLTKFITLSDTASENPETLDNHITSWYLVKIEDTKFNTIYFTYKTKPSHQLYNKTGESYMRNMSQSSPGLPVIALNSSKNSSYTSSFISEKVLEKIKADDTEIIFVEDNTNRLDFANNKALKEIQIKVSGRQIQKVVFDYDYFTSNNNYPYDHYFYQQQDRYRLKLNQLEIYKGTAVQPEKYKFEYNSSNLPNRFSYAQDAWGFFNGKSNSELIPKLNLYPILNIASEIGSADRSISTTHTQANILTKIIYPTGGATSFEYESNRVGRIIDLQEFPIQYFSNTMTRNFLLEPDKEFGPGHVTVIDKPEYRARLSITNPSGLINFMANVEGCTTQLNNSNCIYIIKIIGVGNSTFTTITQSSIAMHLPAGEYDIVAVHTGNGSSQVSGFTVTAYWDEIKNPDMTDLEVGGLRVKNINFYDHNNAYLYSRTYEYTEKNAENKLESSGKIISYPTFIEFPYYIHLPKSFKISSNAIFPLSNLASSAVIYTNVIERRTDQNNLDLGKTEYGYSFDERFDLQSNYTNTLKDKTNSILNWRNGLLLYKKDYDRNSNPIRTLLNEYSSKNIIEIQNFGALFEARESSGTNMPVSIIENQLYRYLFYPFITDTFSIDKSETVDYLNGKTVHTKVEYFYNNPLHYQLTSEKTIQSDLSIQESTYRYAHEKGNQKLINANIIGVPLETEIKENGKLVSKSETKYDHPVDLFPSSSVSYDLQNNTPSTEVTYDQYDSKGNLLQYTTKEGIPVSIIWGYNQTQPIAKIAGAKLADIPQTLINSIVNASISDAQLATDASEQSLISALDLFRNNTALSGYQISTYSYDPLIGVTSVTPSSGIREVYIYDTANRLKEIRELSKTGKILKEYKYNYKN